MSSGTTQLQLATANQLKYNVPSVTGYFHPAIETIVTVSGITLFGVFTLGVGYGFAGAALYTWILGDVHSSIARTDKVRATTLQTNIQMELAKVQMASCKIQDEATKSIKNDMAYTASVLRSGAVAAVALLASISSYYFYNYMLTTHGEECRGAKYSYLSSTLVSVGAVINLFRTVIWDKK
jgi:hypothetical protein